MSLKKFLQVPKTPVDARLFDAHTQFVKTLLDAEKVLNQSNLSTLEDLNVSLNAKVKVLEMEKRELLQRLEDSRAEAMSLSHELDQAEQLVDEMQHFDSQEQNT